MHHILLYSLVFFCVVNMVQVPFSLKKMSEQEQVEKQNVDIMLIFLLAIFSIINSIKIHFFL